MKFETTDTDALAAVEPRAVRAYLDAHGWQRTGPYGRHADAYERDDAPAILAPASKTLLDYPRRIGEIVEILARVERRDTSAVHRDLTNAGCDLIRVRARHADEDGSVPLERGVALVAASRDMLLAAACAAMHPAATFRPDVVEEAAARVRSARLGQTERDGFVVALLCPIPPELAPPRARRAEAPPSPEVDTPFL